jgi:PAS domain S-box-containing protein
MAPEAPSVTLDAVALLDAAPDAMLVVGEDGRVMLVNVQAERMLGFAREDLVGQPLSTLIPPRFRSAHAGHVDRFFTRPTTRPMGAALDLWVLTRAGDELPIEVSLSPVRTSGGGRVVCAALRDVSSRKAMERASRVATERLENAVEGIEDALALYDGSDRLMLCNSAFRKLIGTRLPGALVGRAYDEILTAWLADADLGADVAQAQPPHAPGDDRRSFELRTRSGRRLRVTNRRTHESGFVQTVWDLTDDMRREQELQAAHNEAKAASVAKSEFLASMSHELRTPLNAILGFAQLLQRDKKVPLADRHRDRIDHILKGGEHLLQLINEVLDLSRIEAGRVSVSPEPVAVEPALQEVMQTLDPMAARAEITLRMDPVDPTLPRVIADRTRFKQVLMNFGSNAIKYGRAGGHAWLRTQRIDGWVRVTVVDDGIGIPADNHAKIFQPFFRGGQETGPIDGTGIGLTISKRLAELMGGRVGFTSAEGEGSAFWLDLPAEALDATSLTGAPIRAAAEGSPLAGTVGARFLVVYVEDNPSNIAFMVDLLGELDRVDLITAPTAEIGIELIRARQPNVVIMDINLPGMSGLEATTRLQEWPETRHIPVIALTAAAMPREAERLRQAGFYAYLTKPVQVDALTGALERLLLPDESSP